MSGSSSPSRQHPAAGETNEEPGLDPEHLVLEQLDAVAGRLGPSCRQEVGRRDPVAGQESVHVGGGRVARHSSIDDGDAAPRSSQYESRAQAGCSAADHHNVVGLRLHHGHLHRHPALDLRI
jgi:hypothetical protein